MSVLDCKILCWNVRGLNAAAKRASVRNLIISSRASIVCLQETKISVWNDILLKETLGPILANQSVFIPATGASGGIIVAASDRFFDLQSLSSTPHTVSANIVSRADGTCWTISSVYGPQTEQDKINFLAELSSLKTTVKPAWLLLGDFNLICSAQDKNNNRISMNMIQRFNRTLDDLQVMEIALNGKRFTWSNGQDSPTLSRIDHFFATTEWLDLFPNSDLQAIASMDSDHSPLFLQGNVNYNFYKGFRFEAFWSTLPGFLEMVQASWSQSVDTRDAILRLHIKMRRLATSIKIWKAQQVGNIELQLAIVHVVLLCLEKAQERRQLSEIELHLPRSLKAKSLGLAAMQKPRAKQHSRLKWIKQGDANTKFFHLHANIQRNQHFIKELQSETGIVMTQQDKEEAIFNFYNSILGVPPARNSSLDWTVLGYEQTDLSDLEAPFSENEIKRIIHLMPSQRAPGPDGFIGLFYKKCWDIVRSDLSEALCGFYNLCTNKLHLANEANIVLLPKK
jgi:exonuclease III